MEKKKDRLLKSGDIIIIVSLLLVSLGIGIFSLLSSRGRQESAVISVDGEIFGTYPLSEDRSITVTSGSVEAEVEISGGRVRIVRSTCPNNDCVHQGWIDSGNEVIVCLPGRITVSLSGAESGADSVTY